MARLATAADRVSDFVNEYLKKKQIPGCAVMVRRNGKVVLLEFVVPSGNQPHPAKIIDIEMLFFPGGRERMQEQWRELFAGAGFRLSRILPTKSPFSVIEAEVG